MPNFEVLDARIASALNKIMHNSHFKRKIILEEQKAQKEDRFLRGRTDCLLDLRTIPGHWNRWFCRKLHRPVHYCSSKWRLFRNSIQSGTEFYCSMTKIPHDDILEELYKLRIRESEKLKTVLELYDLETHQKKLGPDYHRLKAMVKRSIEQEIRNKNFGARNGKLWGERRGQESGNKTACTKNSWRLLPMGNQRAVCKRKTIAVSATISISVEQLHHQIRLRILSCSRMSENHREPEVPEEKVPVVEGLGGLARITSKELAIAHFVKGGTLQNPYSTRPRVVVGLGKSAHTHIVRLMNSGLKGLKRMMTKVQWLCWRKMAWKRTCYRPMSRSIGETWQEEW